MSPKCLLPLSVLLIAGIASPALAQYASAPTAYTMTQVFYPPSGVPLTMTMWRDGPVVLQHPSGSASSSYFDLRSHTSYGWNSTDSRCSANAFAGDWGDPFATADVAAELSRMHAHETGTEIVNGIRTKVFEADAPDIGGKYRVWLDAMYGEEIKAVSVDASKKVTPLIVEVKSLTLGKPTVNLALPSMCAKASITPLPQPQPTEAQRIATLTGSAPGTYVSAINGPGSKETCTVQFSIAMAKTMAVLGGGYRVALDPFVDPDHPATYAQPGNPFFTGGGLREITGLLQSGVANLPTTGATFNMQISHDQTNAQYTFAATIYRQCFGKSAAKLFYVVNSAGSFEGGEWVWAK